MPHRRTSANSQQHLTPALEGMTDERWPRAMRQ
jgi:hypothetical protein